MCREVDREKMQILTYIIVLRRVHLKEVSLAFRPANFLKPF